MRIVIPGEPQGKGRARVTKWGTYTPEKTVMYENLIKTIAIDARIEPFGKGVQLAMDIYAYFGIPKSARKRDIPLMLDWEIRPTKKPDIDNICKVVCDALNGIAYHDDAQIVTMQVRKYYADVPRVIINLYRLWEPKEANT
jgi:Holliday junction resolvase RusA-like endonuclease